MQLQERNMDGVMVLDLAGKFTHPEDAGKLKDKITSLVYQGQKHIVLNLADLSYVDSSGLGELVACYTTAARGDASVKLANPGRRMQDLLVLTKLLTIFESYETEREAVASYAASSV